MSDLKRRGSLLLAGLCLLLTLGSAGADDSQSFAHADVSVEATAQAQTLARLQLDGPVAIAELQAALASLQGRPLDEALLADADSLIRDVYAWLEWQILALQFTVPSESPGLLQVKIEAAPPEPWPLPPALDADSSQPATANLSPGYQDWLQSPARVLVVAQDRIMYFKHRDEVLRFPVAVGTDRTPTPPGEYRVQAISHKPTWYPTRSIRRDHAARGIALPAVVPPGPGNPLGDWFVRLRDSIGIHGTDAPDSIGQASSYGCIRMRAEDIDRVARLLRRGDRVVVIDHLPQQLTLRD